MLALPGGPWRQQSGSEGFHSGPGENLRLAGSRARGRDVGERKRHTLARGRTQARTGRCRCHPRRRDAGDEPGSSEYDRVFAGMVRVKVCGITSLADALLAVDNGADALGFVFFRKSPRNVTPEAVVEIVKGLPPFVSKVGVFVDSPLEMVVQILLYA